MRRDGRGGGRQGQDRGHVGGLQSGRPPRPLRGRRARAGRACPCRARPAGRDRRSGRRRPRPPRTSVRPPGRSGRDRRGRGHDRPGTHRRSARRASARPRRSLWLGTFPSWASTISRATSTRLCWRSPTWNCPWWSSSCPGGTRCSWRWTRRAAIRCSGRRSTTRRARPSTKWPATSASATPGARRSTGWRCRVILAPSAFPGRCRRGPFDFSFSGIKTAVVNYVRAHPEVTNADVAASFQEAVVDVLVAKSLAAAEEIGARGGLPGRGRGGQLVAAGAFCGGFRRPGARSRTFRAERCARTTPP